MLNMYCTGKASIRALSHHICRVTGGQSLSQYQLDKGGAYIFQKFSNSLCMYCVYTRAS